MLTEQQIENRLKWVTFLKDPTYKKAQRRMVGKREDGTEGYCCLMKGCMVMDPDAVRKVHEYVWPVWATRPLDVYGDTFSSFYGISKLFQNELVVLNDSPLNITHEEIGMIIHYDTLLASK